MLNLEKSLLLFAPSLFPFGNEIVDNFNEENCSNLSCLAITAADDDGLLHPLLRSSLIQFEQFFRSQIFVTNSESFALTESAREKSVMEGNFQRQFSTYGAFFIGLNPDYHTTVIRWRRIHTTHWCETSAKGDKKTGFLLTSTACHTFPEHAFTHIFSQSSQHKAFL